MARDTKALIVRTAMRLFTEQGYDATTMRAIAGEAGVSVGNAYYYFASKEHLIQGFYDAIEHEHADLARARLIGSRGFGDRYRAVLTAWLDVAAPHHDFAGEFFRFAAAPTSPLSPFSAESRPARETAIALMRDALDGADLTVPSALAPRLPELLWLAQMGMVLLWVYDGSPGQQRTRLLIERAVPLVERALRMTRLPVVRGLVTDAVGLLDLVQDPSAS